MTIVRRQGPRRASALPSVRARLLAFAAIVAAGVCGGLIGLSYARLSCKGSCSAQEGGAGLAGAVLAAVGVAVIATLTLRAMGEWRRISDEELLGLDDEGDEAGDDGAEGQDGHNSRNPSA
jgi:hypothetical protein